MPTGIEWAEETWNPLTGCTKVSPGCDHCYMYRDYPRRQAQGVLGYEAGPEIVTTRENQLWKPSRWKQRRVIFVNSMSDTFHAQVPKEFLHRIFDVMEENDQHIYQVLTKRPGRAVAFYKERYGNKLEPWPDHIWLGTSVESQKYAPRIDVLSRVPAWVRFVSAEPLLGPLDLRDYFVFGEINWVIAGGESGPGARPMDIQWAVDLQEQCASYGVPYFLKQLGGVRDKRGGDKARLPDGLRYTEMPQFDIPKLV